MRKTACNAGTNWKFYAVILHDHESAVLIQVKTIDDLLLITQQKVLPLLKKFRSSAHQAIFSALSQSHDSNSPYIGQNQFH